MIVIVEVHFGLLNTLRFSEIRHHCINFLKYGLKCRFLELESENSDGINQSYSSLASVQQSQE